MARTAPAQSIAVHIITQGTAHLVALPGSSPVPHLLDHKQLAGPLFHLIATHLVCLPKISSSRSSTRRCPLAMEFLIWPMTSSTALLSARSLASWLERSTCVCG